MRQTRGMVGPDPQPIEPPSWGAALRRSGAERGGRLPQLDDLPDVGGKRVLVRCDFNVPIRRGRIVNDLRIRAATPTLDWLVRRGALVTVCTHLGRPGGIRDTRWDLLPVQERLEQLVPGVELLENLRYHRGEEGNDRAFAEWLVHDHDLYVNEAFASSHRSHASVMWPPRWLPSAAGRLLSREVAVLSAMRSQARRPFVAVLGGAMDDEKMAGLHGLAQLVDLILLGGPLGLSIINGEGDPSLDELLAGGKILLPRDLLVGPRGESDQRRPSGPGETWKSVLVSGAVSSGHSGLAGAGLGTTSHGLGMSHGPAGSHGRGGDPRAVDIGHLTCARYGEVIDRAGTIFWDGSMGVGGDPWDPDSPGTRAIAAAVASSPAFTVAAGVDTLEVLDRLRLSPFVDHVSTGGAASLAFLRDGDLPGVQALRG